MSPDPYAVLEVGRGVDDAELRAAYRRAVQRHHPDHNGGSAESARRFEDVQEAYRAIREQRASGASGGRATEASSGSGPRTSTTTPDLDARLAAMESELAAAREVREQAARAARAASDEAGRLAREAARRVGTNRERASDEELGYVTTDDSFGAIFADAAAGLSEQLSEARRRSGQADRTSTPPAAPGSASDSASGGSRVADRMADVFEDIGARLRGEKRQD